MYYLITVDSFYHAHVCLLGFPGGSVVRNPPASAGDAGELGLIPGSGRSPRGERATYFHILAGKIPMDRGAWWATVSKVEESDMTEQKHNV